MAHRNAASSRAIATTTRARHWCHDPVRQGGGLWPDYFAWTRRACPQRSVWTSGWTKSRLPTACPHSSPRVHTAPGSPRCVPNALYRIGAHVASPVCRSPPRAKRAMTPTGHAASVRGDVGRRGHPVGRWVRDVGCATMDPPSIDRSYPPSMEPVAITSHGARLNGIIYVALGSGPHRTAILLHGYPGRCAILSLGERSDRGRGAPASWRRRRPSAPTGSW